MSGRYCSECRKLVGKLKYAITCSDECEQARKDRLTKQLNEISARFGVKG